MSVSKLHVPAVPARPGEQPDFSYVRLSAAGAVPRPEPDVAVAETAPLAESLVRVLDDSGQAVGPWNPKLDTEQLLQGLRLMLLTRLFDERMQRTQRQGRITFYVRSLGEEAVSVAAAMALNDRDMLFPSYRNQGLHVARGMSLVDLMCQLLSNSRDMCRGRQLPVMYHSVPHRLFSISGNLATQFPQAVGWAMAAAIKGESDIAAAWIGEGSTAAADFHHALTFAKVYRTPVILNIVNNQWAISTFQGYAGGEQRSFAARGPGIGLAGLRLDGNDFLAVHAATAWAAERARAGHGATVLELVTYRAGAHSTSDDPTRYRPREEFDQWPLGDPIVRLAQHLERMGVWDAERHAALATELEQEVAVAWRAAIAHGTLTEGPKLDPTLMFEDVFKELPAHLREQRDELLAEIAARE
ncbi:MAG: 3-methyl-2-oxobutanoate dehydrogenase (2-methylpropanoyl-transferring) subunit alpha [Gammaproteobacteria bacterium]|nr:3-methyl-2-oxobutanoate dehydrogenase (2-methylpropanoyl-transferring) subunit alpha [Gammaproteobacteria bacterium]